MAFDEGVKGSALIYMPVIVLAELYYLNVKNNYPTNFSSDFQTIKQSGQFIIVSFEADDVLDFDKHSSVSEMHDRMITGVARRLNAPILTKDQSIVSSGIVNVIW